MFKNLESIAQDCNVQYRNHIPLDQECKLPILKVKEDNFCSKQFC